jgi:hypothetical protein
MDKVGKLDEIDHPEIVVYSSLLRGYPSGNRPGNYHQESSFWSRASDGKSELVKYFKETNQVFLAEYEFPTHNQF